ncbi:hypothetical protein, partial [Shewanella chilikensis]|uniref:hypothetical protein n=1 Tax=Shewanella chilikensis TaxID=558541 RepID=UPI001F3EBB3D
ISNSFMQQGSSSGSVPYKSLEGRRFKSGSRNQFLIPSDSSALHNSKHDIEDYIPYLSSRFKIEKST